MSCQVASEPGAYMGHRARTQQSPQFIIVRSSSSEECHYIVVHAFFKGKAGKRIFLEETRSPGPSPQATGRFPGQERSEPLVWQRHHWLVADQCLRASGVFCEGAHRESGTGHGRDGDADAMQDDEPKDLE